MRMEAEWITTGWTQVRQRYAWIDHAVRAVARYDTVDAGRLAAAVTYYAFFATFALGLLGFAVLGYVLDDAVVMRNAQNYLATNLPRLDAQALRDARSTAGVVALLALPLTGLFWVDSLRSSIRAVWRLPEYPGRYWLRQVIDLAVLAGLGVLLAVSLAIAVGTEALLRWLLVDAAGGDGTLTRWLLAAAGYLLGLAVNTVLAVAVLTALPRLRMSTRRVLGPALLIAAGLELLKTLGRIYVERTETNPAYHVVAGAVGLLVFLNILNHVILFAAALTATSGAGRVVDLAGVNDRVVTVRATSRRPPPGTAGWRARRRTTGWRSRRTGSRTTAG